MLDSHTNGMVHSTSWSWLSRCTRASKKIHKMAKRLAKRKVDSECRVCNQGSTSDYFFVQCKEMAVCLICQETVSVFKEYNLRRHYETRHRDKHASLHGQMRADKVSKLKSGLLAQQNTFICQTQLNQSSARASFQVAKLIATSGRPFSDGECVKICINSVVEVCPDKKDVLNVQVQSPDELKKWGVTYMPSWKRKVKNSMCLQWHWMRAMTMSKPTVNTELNMYK